MRIAEPHGAVIEMDGDGYDYYVRGHVDAAEAIAAVRDRLLEDDDPEDVPDLGPCEHVWGRWVRPGPGDGCLEEWQSVVWDTRRDRAPGYARVTRVWDADAWQDREERRAVEYRVRSDAARRWPGCVVTSVYSWPWRSLRDVSAEILLGRHGVCLTWHPWSQRSSVRSADWRTTRVALLAACARAGLRLAA